MPTLAPLESAQPALAEPIGILGYGVEGASTLRYLRGKGFSDLTVFDRKAPEGLDASVRYAGPGDGSPLGYLRGLESMRTVFRSAGVRPDLPALAEFVARGGILTSQTGLAFALAGRQRIIGVTGTVGKGTCCSLLEAMLGEAGIPVRLGGNIGVPALELAGTLADGERLILELSSFQLSTLAQSPALAAVLRTTTEHLDWHADRDEYWLHKSRLVSSQSPADAVAYCADAEGSAWIASLSAGRKLPFGAGAEIRIDGDSVAWTRRGFRIPLSATRLTGAFNLENIAAAGALALEAGAEPGHVIAGAMAFAGLEHRLEFIRERNGLSFYNDSYATRPEATIGAVRALAGRPLGLILGGSEKHADFSELAGAIAAAPQAEAVALIGQTAGRLEEALRLAGLPRPGGSPAIKTCAGLEDAVAFLMERVPRGALLLSPACASFGLFENYKERGKAFKKLVAGL
jgi:UDP-N-acetylmuramoylalanine--D-glutamate ligase